jgi:hypothetical protein
LRAWQMLLRPASPGVPAFLLQKLEASVVTAAVALRLARAFQPSRHLSNLASRLKIPKVALFAGLIAIGVVLYVLVNLPEYHTLGIAVFLTLLVAGTAVTGRFLINLFTRLGNSPVRAFLAWYEAGQPEERSVEDFLTAIALYTRIAYNLTHLETLFIVLRKNKDYTNLIQQAELDSDEVWDIVEERVREEIGEIADAPPAAVFTAPSEAPC